MEVKRIEANGEDMLTGGRDRRPRSNPLRLRTSVLFRLEPRQPMSKPHRQHQRSVAKQEKLWSWMRFFVVWMPLSDHWMR